MTALSTDKLLKLCADTKQRIKISFCLKTLYPCHTPHFLGTNITTILNTKGIVTEANISGIVRKGTQLNEEELVPKNDFRELRDNKSYLRGTLVREVNIQSGDAILNALKSGEIPWELHQKSKNGCCLQAQ